MFRRDVESDGAALALLQPHSLKALELLERPGDGAEAVADIHLDRFAAGASTSVGDIHHELRRGIAADLGFCEAWIFDNKRCVAEAETEGVERSDIIEEISSAGGRFVVVICR